MGRKPFLPRALTDGPFTVDEARQAGLQRWHLRSRIWRRVSRGIYVWAGGPDTPMARLLAASRRLPDDAAFSGLTAAWLHGLDVLPCDPIEVTVPRELGISGRAGLRVRRSPLPDIDVVRIRGVRATTMLRTLRDVSRRLPLIEAVVVVDAALHKRLVKLDQLASLKRVIQFVEPAAASPMESRLRMILVLAGLPRPKAQVAIYDKDGQFVGRPDLYYEEARLGIEYDGAIHRTTLPEDNRRQNKLLNVGVRLLRFTAVDVFQGSKALVAQVRAGLYSS